MAIDRSNDITRLRIVGNYEDDSRKNIDRITKEVNRELSKIKVSRDTGVDSGITSVNNIAGTETFQAGIIMANATIVDSSGHEWDIDSNGVGLVRNLRGHEILSVTSGSASGDPRCNVTAPAGAQGGYLWYSHSSGTVTNTASWVGGTSYYAFGAGGGASQKIQTIHTTQPALGNTWVYFVEQITPSQAYYIEYSSTGTGTIYGIWFK